MNPELLKILQHSLGVDQFGRHPKGHIPRDEGDGCGLFYRNHFVTDLEGKDGKMCLELVRTGLMADLGKREICGGAHLFRVTESGMLAMRQNSPKLPRLTRSQQRYREYLDSDGIYGSFRQFLLGTTKKAKQAEEDRRYRDAHPEKLGRLLVPYA